MDKVSQITNKTLSQANERCLYPPPDFSYLYTYPNPSSTKNLPISKVRSRIRMRIRRVTYGARWRRERDSNPRHPYGHSGFQDRRIRPLCHLSR